MHTITNSSLLLQSLHLRKHYDRHCSPIDWVKGASHNHGLYYYDIKELLLRNYFPSTLPYIENIHLFLVDNFMCLFLLLPVNLFFLEYLESQVKQEDPLFSFAHVEQSLQVSLATFQLLLCPCCNYWESVDAS